MPEPCWQRAGCCCCCLAAACGPQAGLCSCCSAQLSAHQCSLAAHTAPRPSPHSWEPPLPAWDGGVCPKPQPAFLSLSSLGHAEKFPLKQWDWRKGNKFEDFYTLRAQMYILRKSELLILEMRQSRSWFLIRSGPTFVWYWRSHLSAMKCWQNLADSPLLPISSIAQVELFYQLLWVCMRPLVWPVWEIRAKQGIMDPVELILAITES